MVSGQLLKSYFQTDPRERERDNEARLKKKILFPVQRVAAIFFCIYFFFGGLVGKYTCFFLGGGIAKMGGKNPSRPF